MSFTEFCCRSGGSNLNAGTRTGDSTEPGTSADLTYAGGTWVNATKVFTVASGNPVADGVAVGDYAAIDTGGVTAALVGRVNARTTTTITVAGNNGMGTNPANGTYTLRIGGAWKGPNGTDGFPLNLGTVNGLVNAAGNPVRVNLKNDDVYAITALITLPSNVRRYFQGYTSSYGDGGRCVIDGGNPATSFVLMDIQGVFVGLIDCILCNNGDASSGSSNGLNVTAASRVYLENVTVHGVRGFGVGGGTAGHLLVRCEAYDCCKENGSGSAGFSIGGTLINCIGHHNVGSNASGFNSLASTTLMNCIADSNGASGFSHSAAGSAALIGCDAYNNGQHGFRVASGQANMAIINSNAVKNTLYGVSVGAGDAITMLNVGFGAGTMANGSGQKGIAASCPSYESGSVTYDSDENPWVDPATGDFRISLGASKNTGWGRYLQSQSGYTGTVGYPDIGSAQHQDAGGSTLIVIED